jgi:hypothetical protein
MARRRIALLLVAACAMAAAGCGNKESVTTHADTEGTYIDVGPLKYQVQISRLLNPNDPEDRGYLVDLPPSQRRLGRGEQWFAVFMLVQNGSESSHRVADDYVIRDTQGTVFRPITMGRKNVFAYRVATTLPPHINLPLPDSPAGQNSIQGAMLLFKIPVANFENRPLVLEISSSDVPNVTGTVDLDV